MQGVSDLIPMEILGTNAMLFSTKYIASFLVAFLVAYLLTPVVRSLAMRIGMMDLPDERRIHRNPTPRGGGLAIAIGFFVAYQVADAAGWLHITHSLNLGWWQTFVGASAILIMVGLVDDYYALPAWLKLIAQVTAATLMFVGGCRFGVLLGVSLPPLLDYVITLCWFIGITNAFNLIDGLDGLATGLALITAVGLAGVLLLQRVSGDAMVLLMLAGACAAFLRYNFHPASIFLGDTGSLFLGFTLASVSLATQSKGTFMAAVGVPLLAMGVPLFDTILAIWRRSLRMMVPWAFPERRPPRGVMAADAEHLHHRFLGYGLKQHQVALALYGINVALVVIGLLSIAFKAHIIAIYIVSFMVATYLVFRHLAKEELWDTGRALVYGLGRPAGRQVAYFAYLGLDITCLFAAWTLANLLTNYFDPAAVNRTDILLSLPYWIAPTFVILAATGVYNRVWSRAQVCDYLYLTLAIGAGVLASSSLAALSDHALGTPLMSFAVVFGGCLHFLITGTRVFFRGIRELMARLYHSETFVPVDGNEERVLLFGAGGRCMLYLREIGFDLFAPTQHRRVVGLIDDDPNLRRRSVYGHRVLGNRQDLPKLIKDYRIERVIITALLTDESRDELAEIARTAGVSLSDWQTSEAMLVAPGPRLAHVRDEADAPVTLETESSVPAMAMGKEGS